MFVTLCVWNKEQLPKFWCSGFLRNFDPLTFQRSQAKMKGQGALAEKQHSMLCNHV